MGLNAKASRSRILSEAPHEKADVSHFIMPRRMSSFQKYFEFGGEESLSPFLNDRSKRLSQNLTLKSAVCAASLLLISSVFLFIPHLEAVYWISSILLAFVYLLVGTPALISAGEDVLFQKDINIDVLMTISAFGALALGRPFEGALLLVLFALSGSLEDLVTLKAKSALASIHDIAPSKASVLASDGTFFERSVQDITVGAKILARAGEIVPLDGIVVSGSGAVSSAHLTGESRPHEVTVGEKVVSGSLVDQGSFILQVTTTQADSTVAKIVRLITKAQSSKPKLSQTFENFGKSYSIAVISISLSLLALFPLLFHVPLHGPEGALVRAMSFLITASPCALFLAVPIAYLSALSAAVRKGAILKGGKIFDRLLQCSSIAFDKTGTLTQGAFQLYRVIPCTKTSLMRSTDELLSIAASVEQHVVHPIARAIVGYAKEKKLPLFEVSSVQVYAGIGVKAILNNQRRSEQEHSSENERTIADVSPQECIEVSLRAPNQEDIEAINTIEEETDVPEDGTSVAMEIRKTGEDKIVEKYLFFFEDAIRPESFSSIQHLKKLHKRVLMLSGDSELVAKKVAKTLHIDEWKSGLKPQDKLAIISQLSKNSQQGLVMVGDGLNDAPALARATVGVSMGQLSSASARDAADIVLLQDNLSLLPWLFTKARLTRKVVVQNLCIALLAIGIGTTSSLFGIIPLWAAVLLHEGSTLIVGLNALRLLK